MQELISYYLITLLITSFHTWLVGAVLALCGGLLVSAVIPMPGGPLKALLASVVNAVLWPRELPRWMLTLWPLTFFAFPFWMVLWFFVMPFAGGYRDRRPSNPGTPDTVTA